MFSFPKRIGVMGSLGLAVWALTVTQAQGQSPFFQVRPGLTLQQHAFNIATMGRALSFVPPYALGINPFPQVAIGGPGFSALTPFSPYGGTGTLTTNPYATSSFGSAYGYSYYDPYGFNGYLRGGAEVINAQGRFMVSQQQANLTNEQVRAERIANRRRVFDEYLYEREKTPTLEQERERSRLQERDRSRNDPPVTEIWSGKALNDLLLDLQKLQVKAVLTTDSGPEVRLDEDMLKRINVTAINSGGHIGLLKNEGRLSWPLTLHDPAFKEERERLTLLAQEAPRQATFNNRVDPGTLRQMQDDVARLHKQLTDHVRSSPPAPYMEAKRFLNNFEGALKALQQPNVSSYFNGGYTLKGKTVPELVKYMTEKGLRFAPAGAGDESTYLALHRAMARYDFAAQAPVAEQRSVHGKSGLAAR